LYGNAFRELGTNPGSHYRKRSRQSAWSWLENQPQDSIKIEAGIRQVTDFEVIALARKLKVPLNGY
jgi:hypothetical protein